MRILKIMLTMFVLGALIFSFASCGTQSTDGTQTGKQVATVPRGNLEVAITAVGNLALSRTEELAFDLFYGQSGSAGIKGTVGEVLVEEGDTVKEGQVLVTLDKDEWEEQLSALEDKVTAAERQVTAKERALLQVKLNLIDAKSALEEAEAQYVWPDEIFAAREAVWAAESDVEEAQAMLDGGLIEETYDRETGEMVVTIEEARTPWDVEVWAKTLTSAEETLRTARIALDELLVQSYAEAKIALAEEKLMAAQVKLDGLIAKSATEEELATQRRIVELAQEQLADIKEGLEAVAKKQLQLEQAEGNLEDAQQAIDDARKTLADAQKNLDKAKAKSPLITAPFDGFITQVNVAGGDEVLKGTVAVVIADPNKFEAEIVVSEMDISQVKEGGEVRVTVDAMSGLTLPATVTHISPTATIQSGVVNYKVKVEIQSLAAVVQERQQARQAASENVSSGGLPPRLQQAIDEGRITKEQAEAMMNRVQQAQPGQPAPVPAVISENFQLREGLTVTVSIIVAEATDVLLVPNSAITTQGGKTFVQVLAADGTQEQREIQTGLSDYRNTEVTSGLSEGEQIVVPQGTVTTTSTTQSGQRPQGGMFIPGMGRLR